MLFIITYHCAHAIDECLAWPLWTCTEKWCSWGWDTESPWAHRPWRGCPFEAALSSARPIRVQAHDSPRPQLKCHSHTPTTHHRHTLWSSDQSPIFCFNKNRTEIHTKNTKRPLFATISNKNASTYTYFECFFSKILAFDWILKKMCANQRNYYILIISINQKSSHVYWVLAVVYWLWGCLSWPHLPWRSWDSSNQSDFLGNRRTSFESKSQIALNEKIVLVKLILKITCLESGRLQWSVWLCKSWASRAHGTADRRTKSMDLSTFETSVNKR